MSKFNLCNCLLLLCCLLISCRKEATQVETIFTAGVSAAPINPPVGSFIAGDKQNRKFTGVHDSLFVKAIVISDGTSSLALVTLDCIGLLYTDVQRIRKRTAELTDFPAERIIVSSTHTHSGPDVVGIWGSDYEHTGVDSMYMKFVVNTAADQIKNAYDGRQEATAVTAETTFGEPWVQNICNEEIDRSVTILQFQNNEGKPIATLTNFACHPTFLDSRFSEVSADYVSGYYKRLKQLTGGEALFLQGAIGGWVQPEDGEGSFEKALKRGNQLADAVFNALPSAKPLTTTTIRFNSRQVKFPVENEAWKQLSVIGTVAREFSDSVASEVAWFSIGAAQFATHPGETAPYYGLETKKLMKSGPKFVLGLGNDALGYILKPTFFEDQTIPHAEYLTSMSVGKPTAPLLMKTIEELIPD